MADYYNFPDHRKGDTFSGTTFQVNVDGTPLNITGATIKMMMKHKKKNVKKLLTSYSGITISNPSSGEFKIDRQIIDTDPGEYVYDIEIELADGTVKTYIKGSWTIKQDITYA